MSDRPKIEVGLFIMDGSGRAWEVLGRDYSRARTTLRGVPNGGQLELPWDIGAWELPTDYEVDQLIKAEHDPETRRRLAEQKQRIK